MSNNNIDLLEYFDDGFITPKKKQQYKKPSPPRFFSSKMKAIADTIHKNTFSKYRVHCLEEGKTKLYAYSQLRQISETSKSRSLTKIRSLPRIQQISRTNKVKILGREKISLEMRQACFEKIERLYCCERLKITRREQLIKRTNQNRQLAQQLSSYQQKKLLLQSITNSIKVYDLSCTRLNELCQLFSKKAHQSYMKLSILQKHKQQIKCLQSQLNSISQKVKRIQKQYNILCEETIQSLFYTGTLMQQLFVASCGKVDKRSGTLAKIQSILYGRLHRRTFILDFDEEITEVCMFLTIYMHSKSVSLNNIAVLMDSLSFYSDHFRELYCFETFKKYSHFFIEKCLMNFEEQKVDKLNQILLERQKKVEEDQKIKILISVPGALEKIMKKVLEVFRISSNQSYAIFEGTTKLDFHITDEALQNQSQWQLRFSQTRLQQQ